MKIDEHFEWAPKQKMTVRFVFAIGVGCLGNFTQYMINNKLVYFKHSIPGWTVIHGWRVRPGYTHMHDTDTFNEAPPLNA